MKKEKNSFYLIDLILIGCSVKLFRNHEGRMIRLQKALLIRSRVQIAQAFVHPINTDLHKEKIISHLYKDSISK